MSYRRYNIRAGATTTAGGTVRASSDFFKINGISVAVEGDPVDCPACGTQGVIRCVVPRIPERYNGKEIALSDDLCICRCIPPPKLIADQHYDFQLLHSDLVESEDETTASGAQSKAGRTPGANMTAASAMNAKAADLRPVRLIDEETGRPHANRPYRLELKDGKVISGTTDSTGATSPFTPEERVVLRTWQAE